jgi:hypothetical protein
MLELIEKNLEAKLEFELPKELAKTFNKLEDDKIFFTVEKLFNLYKEQNKQIEDIKQKLKADIEDTGYSKNGSLKAYAKELLEVLE